MSHSIGLPLRILLASLAIALQLMVALSHAQEAPRQISIVEVRKKLQMSSNDPIIRDYYVNAGHSFGLRPGAHITVFRKIPLADPSREKAQTHIEIPVGTMRILHSDNLTAIGRIHQMRSPAEVPVLESDFFMVGDRLDMSSLGFERTVDAGASLSQREEQVSSLVAPTAAESESEAPRPAKVAPAVRATASKPSVLTQQANSVEVLTK
jgi:hypothetical protein